MEIFAIVPDEKRRTVNIAAYLDDHHDWTVWARVMPPTYTVGELKIWPTRWESFGPDGALVEAEPDPNTLKYGTPEWRMDLAPERGMPFRRLRDISATQFEECARAYVEDQHSLFVERGMDPRRFNRFAGKPELTTKQRLAVLANEYVHLLEDPAARKRTSEVLAEQYGRTAAWVTSELYRARTNGLLTKPGQGKAGGRLTDLGRQVLSELGDISSDTEENDNE